MAPRRNRREVVGYLTRDRIGIAATDVKGSPLPWVFSRTVEEYQHPETGDVSAAVILVHLRRKGLYAVGYWLGDSGTLFRGEKVIGSPGPEMDAEAKAAAEYWIEQDREQERFADEQDDDD